MPAAGAGVHRRDEHEGAGQCEGIFGAADGNHAVLQWLTQGFQHRARKLRQFVEEEYAVVCQADFAGHEGVAATDEGDDACLRLWCGVKIGSKPDD